MDLPWTRRSLQSCLSRFQKVLATFLYDCCRCEIGFSSPARSDLQPWSRRRPCWYGWWGLRGVVEYPSNIDFIRVYSRYECWSLRGVVEYPSHIDSIRVYIRYERWSLWGVVEYPFDIDFIRVCSRYKRWSLRGVVRYPSDIDFIRVYSRYNVCWCSGKWNTSDVSISCPDELVAFPNIP